VPSLSDLPPAEAGSPHNYVCYECREPKHLIHCKTCCRSYHINCLPGELKPKREHDWYCAACKQRKWDVTPPITPRRMIGVHEFSGPRSLSVGDLYSRAKADPSRRHSGPAQKGRTFSEDIQPARSSHSKAKLKLETAEASHASNGYLRSNALELSTTEHPLKGKLAYETAAAHKSIEQPIQESSSDHPAGSHDVQIETNDQAVRRMQAEIETLREELRKKEAAPRELDDLRLENASLKRKIELMETASVRETDRELCNE
jgi:hypothetical protein